MNITGGTFSSIVDIYGGWATTGNADYNTVTITGGSFAGIFIVGREAITGNATGNTVNISGGTFSGVTGLSPISIYGGYSLNGNANYNTVILNGLGLDLSSASLYGGGGSGDLRTGNRLVIKNKATVGEVGNFEYYEFHINKSGDDALLTGTTGETIALGSNAHFIVNITVFWSSKIVIPAAKKSYTIPNLKWTFISVITMRSFVIIPQINIPTHRTI